MLNLRASHDFTRRLGVFARVMNAADKRFADSASVSSNTPVYSPGLPRTYYGGVEDFERVLDMVEEAAGRWLDRFAAELDPGAFRLQDPR